jgi:hypothetical protein
MVLVLWGASSIADPLTGEKSVWLANAAGEKMRIGSVKFEPLGNGRAGFAFRLDESRFSEYFLAMRPFRCLAGKTQYLCHFPYGGERQVSAGDLVPLEYQLMFMHKKPASVNLDSRNGLYWKLRADVVRLVGTLYDAEMDPIIVPHGDRRRPLTEEFLQRADEGSHWLPRLTVE